MNPVVFHAVFVVLAAVAGGLAAALPQYAVFLTPLAAGFAGIAVPTPAKSAPKEGQ